MRIIDHKLIDTTNVTTETNSSAIELHTVVGYSVQVIYTGSGGMSADITVQASNDGNNWSNAAAATSISGSSGNILINASDSFYKYTRVNVANVSGTLSTLTVWIYSRGNV